MDRPPTFPYASVATAALFVAAVFAALIVSSALTGTQTTTPGPLLVADVACAGDNCRQAVITGGGLATTAVADNPDGVSGANVPVWVVGVADSGEPELALTAPTVTTSDRHPASWLLAVAAGVVSSLAGWFALPRAWRDITSWRRARRAARQRRRDDDAFTHDWETHIAGS